MALIANTADEPDPERIVMVDDGTGVDVAIPTVLITKSDGQLIRNAVLDAQKNNEDVSRAKEFVVLLMDFALVIFSFQR